MFKFKRMVLLIAGFLVTILLISGGLLAYSYNKVKAKKLHTAKVTKKVTKVKQAKPAVKKRVAVAKTKAKTPKKRNSHTEHKLVSKRKRTVSRSLKKVAKYTGKRPRIAYTKGDLDLLARLITAEAVAEPFKAKVAVGSVIINRVKSHIFANSIKDVIYQRLDGYYQFTPVLNGWINKPATADSKKAAYLALNGSDTSRGALYYFDTSTKNTWLWSKTIKSQIGNLVFAY